MLEKCVLTILAQYVQLNTKFSIYLYSVRFEIRACAGSHVSLGFSVVGVFKGVFGMGYFSLGVLPALFHFVSLFMFLSFSLFHLKGYRIRLNDPLVSGMPGYLRVTEFYFQKASSYFLCYQGACCIIWYVYPWFWPKIFYRGKPSVFFACSKFSMLVLCIEFKLASWPVCFWLCVCFCICLWYDLDFACIVRHLPAANGMTRVWHAFATVPSGLVVWVAALMQVLSAVLVVYRVLGLEVRCWSYRYKVAYFRRIYLRGCIVSPVL